MRRFGIIWGLFLGFALTGSASADQGDPRLRGLFEQLKSAPSDEEAKLIELRIWSIWAVVRDDDAARYMNQGLVALNARRHKEALQAFTQVTGLASGFAEGWNKRATVEFILGDYDSSVRHIERTLALEPRHFGALSGLAQIYLALDKKEAALKAFEKVLEIDPHLPGVRKQVEKLKKELAGAPT